MSIDRLLACCLFSVLVLAAPLRADAPPTRETVAPGTLTATRSTTGQVTAAADCATVTLVFERYAGPLVVQRALESGQRVRRGQQLLWLDAEPLVRQRAATRAALDEATAQLSLLTAQQGLARNASGTRLRQAQAAARNATTALALFVTHQRPDRIRSSELSLQSRKDALADLQAELDQLTAMYKEDELTEATEELVIKRTKRRLARSRAQLALATTRHRLFVEHELPQHERTLMRAVESSRLALAQLEATDRPARRLAVQQRAKVQQHVLALQTQLEQLDRDRRQLTPTAPTAGVLIPGHARGTGWRDVDERRAELRKGGRVKAGVVLYTVVDPTRATVAIRVEERLLGLLPTGAEGARAEVVPLAHPTVRLRGRLAATSRVDRDKAGTYGARVVLEVPADGPLLMPGMSARVRLTIVREQVLTVPDSALTRRGSGVVVRVPGDADVPAERAVVIGLSGGGRTEVLSGLAAGDVILTTGR